MRQYWLVRKIDGTFELWDGPIPSESNFHWAKYHGHNFWDQPIWVLERSDPPDGLVQFGIYLAGPSDNTRAEAGAPAERGESER